MATHTLEIERRTLHGHFSRDLPPVLSVDTGDTVHYRTLDAGWGLESPRAGGGDRKCFAPRVEELDSGHALIGPLEIRGAEPDMVLEVRINEVRPGPYGWTWAGNWPVTDGDPD